MNSAADQQVSAVAIVRHGFTRRERLLIAKRDPRMMQVVHAQNWDAATVNAICGLCDEFKARHAPGPEEG